MFFSLLYLSTLKSFLKKKNQFFLLKKKKDKRKGKNHYAFNLIMIKYHKKTYELIPRKIHYRV